jgi:hypothetical protein
MTTQVTQPNGEASANTGNTQTATADPQIESKARDMGWIPKDEFRGDQTKWIDAGAYVERAETLLPIVQANNRRLQGEVHNLRTQLNQSTQATTELRESIEDLKKFNTEIAKERVKTNRAEIGIQIKAAREAGDVNRELELQDQLAEANEALRASTTARPATAAPPVTTSPAPPAIHPDFAAWQQANPWYGQEGQERKTNYALAAAQTLRQSNPGLQGKAFFDKVSEEVSAVFEPRARVAASKVEGGTGSTSNGGGGSVEGKKTFADLPPEAQSTARNQAKKFVGPNKSFKTEADWFGHYVTKYFE